MFNFNRKDFYKINRTDIYRSKISWQRRVRGVSLAYSQLQLFEDPVPSD